LKQNGFDNVAAMMVEKGAVKSELDKARETIRAAKANVVFGVGGGVNMDLAKAAGTQEGIPIITVPTIFATDAATSHASVFRDISPGPPSDPILACIVDVTVIKNAPWRFQAAGFADLIGKATGIKDWEFACAHDKEFTRGHHNNLGLELAKLQLTLLMKNAAAIKRKEEEAFNIFLQALTIDGTIMDMGRPISTFGSEHWIAHGIQDFVKILHGEAVGVGTILAMHMYEGDWQGIKQALIDVGAPVTANQLGVSDETIITALTNAGKIATQRPNRYSILNEKPLTTDSARQLAEATGVIA
jgi:glycerol-1-phosphate dehydrogenase [NAD(P)+]